MPSLSPVSLSCARLIARHMVLSLTSRCAAALCQAQLAPSMQQCSMCRVRAASRHTNVTLRNGAASSDGGALVSPISQPVSCVRGKIPYYEMPDDEKLVRFVCRGGRLSRGEVVSECPDGLWEVIASCWAAETAERPTFAGLTATLTNVLLGVVDQNRFRKAADEAEVDAAIEVVSQIRDLSGDNLKTLLDTMAQYPLHAGVQEAGCGAVPFLADDADNKIKIAGEGGVGVVLEAMRQHVGRAGVQEAGCAAVEKLADNRDNGIKIAGEGGIGVVLEAMRQHVGHAGVQEGGCRAVRNLAVNADTKAKIVAEGGLQLMRQAMQKHKDEGVQLWGSSAAAWLRR